jgi:uncharacterized protein YbaA (DUF1428 family)
LASGWRLDFTGLHGNLTGHPTPWSLRAVAARPGEKIVFTWQIRSDREAFQAAEERMHQDARMDTAGEPPFDASRLILGCFQPAFAMGRD